MLSGVVVGGFALLVVVVVHVVDVDLVHLLLQQPELVLLLE